MDRDQTDIVPSTLTYDLGTTETTAIVPAEGVGRLNISNECIRQVARELIASRGKDALAFADYKAAIHERAGRWNDAQLWRKIEGTVLAMVAE